MRSVAVFQYLRGVLDSIIEQKDIDSVALRIGELLDESLAVNNADRIQQDAARFRITQSGKTWAMSTLNFEKLKEEFKHTTYKNI